MPPATVCHLSAAGHSNRVLVQCPVGLPMSPCGCLPPQRCRGTPTASWHGALLGLPMPPVAVCHLSAAGTPTASWSSALSGCQCLLRLSATSALPVLQPRPGPVPNRVANAACNCLLPQRRGHSNRVLVQCPFREPMPPVDVCHLSAAGTSTASWHGDHAHKYSSGILAWRRGHLSTLWHGDPQQNHFWGRVTWQDCLEPVSNRSLADASAGLRHGIPGERPLGGIPAWRGSHLSALRHVDPFHKHLSGIPAWRGSHLSALRP